MTGKEWINGLNRIKPIKDLPITVQGGEPTVHKEFGEIIRGVKQELPIDLLTNLEIDPKRFAGYIPPSRMQRSSPYASIRVSYHHGQSKLMLLIERVLYLQERGYSIGVWEVEHPEYRNECRQRQIKAQSMGIDWRLKEFLGPYKGDNYGSMRYSNAVNGKFLRNCECKSSELLIGPNGDIFRCHSDLYADRSCIANILDPEFTGEKLGLWRPCEVYGKCNSCDIKLTTNRFQQGGHTSVEVCGLGEPTRSNDEFVEEVVNTYGKKDAVK